MIRSMHNSLKFKQTFPAHLHYNWLKKSYCIINSERTRPQQISRNGKGESEFIQTFQNIAVFHYYSLFVEQSTITESIIEVFKIEPNELSIGWLSVRVTT